MNDFTMGAIDIHKLGGRDDSGLYGRSVAAMVGFMPISEGPATRCPGFEYVDTLAAECRTIEFPVTGAVNYVVELYDLYMKIRRDDNYIIFAFGDIGHTWSGAEIDEVQYDRDARAIYFSHIDHPPKVLRYIGLDTFAVDVSDNLPSITFTTNTDETVPFQGIGNYPRAVAIWGSRLWFGGTIAAPSTVWASKTFDFYNHEYYDEVVYTYKQLSDEQTWGDPAEPETEDITVTKHVQSADAAIIFTPAGGKNNEVQTLIPGKDLVVCTTETEYVVPYGTTAANPQMPSRTAFGASPVQGMLGDNVSIFVQGSGARVREYHYRDSDNGYASPDLTFGNSKLVKAGIKTMHLQREPYPYLWFVMTDGTLAGMLYDRNVGALGWFSYPTAPYTVESLSVLPGSGRDTVYAVLKEGGTSHLAKMALIFPYDDLAAGDYRHLMNFIDTTSDGAGLATGLDHLEGQTVEVWVTDDATFSGEYTVVSGEITISEISANISVGMGMGAYVTPNRPILPEEEKGEKANVFKTKLYLANVTDGEVTYGSDVEAFDLELPHELGEVELDVKGEWDRDFFYSITAVGPNPMTILAIDPEVEVT